MNLDELRTVRNKERQTDSLQHLRPTFYEDVGEFVERLRAERERAAERAEDPFDSPEVRRLSDDIKTAERIVEDVYERRVGKVVKLASIAAADMPTDDDGLTREEQELFETLVANIEENREHVFGVLDGEPPDDAPSGDGAGHSTPDPATDAVDAADDTAERGAPERDGTVTDEPAGYERADAPTDAPSPAAETDQPVPPDEPPEEAPADVLDGVDAADVMGGSDGSRVDADPEPDRPVRSAEAPDASTDTDDERAVPGVPRTTVRITRDVGEILGADERAYDLSTDDVVTLPEPNAEPLVQRNAAERLE